MSERADNDAPIDDGEGFLSRWSRRKRDAVDPAPVAVAPEAVVDEQPEPPPLTDADMPPLETLDAQSDYSGFLSPGVSEELRQLALRKLFRSAAFNITDGLDDYAEDFTSFQALGDIVTREMQLRDAVDQARERAKALLADGDAEAPVEHEQAAEPVAADDTEHTEQAAVSDEETPDEQQPRPA